MTLGIDLGGIIALLGLCAGAFSWLFYRDRAAGGKLADAETMAALRTGNSELREQNLALREDVKELKAKIVVLDDKVGVLTALVTQKAQVEQLGAALTDLRLSLSAADRDRAEEHRAQLLALTAQTALLQRIANRLDPEKP